MAVTLGIETIDRVNFRTGTVKVLTDDFYPLKADQQIALGEVLKIVDGKLEKIEATTDAIFCIANQEADSTGADLKISYDLRGSYFANGLTFGVGTVSDFKEQLDLNGRFFIEEI